ncbi:MAG: glycoside hydrolase family 97 C-terminal domain-containing protein, partial [Cyclobacteriaceae bacterium]
LGAMTNWTARDITIDCSFLPKGKWKAVLFQDGMDADVNAQAYEVTTRVVDQNSKINLRLAKGGGAVIRMYRN